MLAAAFVILIQRRRPSMSPCIQILVCLLSGDDGGVLTVALDQDSRCGPDVAFVHLAMLLPSSIRACMALLVTLASSLYASEILIWGSLSYMMMLRM